MSEKQPTTTEPWASVDDVAEHLGVAADSIYRWIENRALPAHKVGRLWKFRLSVVDAWVRRQDGTSLAPSRKPKTRKNK